MSEEKIRIEAFYPNESISFGMVEVPRLVLAYGKPRGKPKSGYAIFIKCEYSKEVIGDSPASILRVRTFDKASRIFKELVRKSTGDCETENVESYLKLRHWLLERDHKFWNIASKDEFPSNQEVMAELDYDLTNNY